MTINTEVFDCIDLLSNDCYIIPIIFMTICLGLCVYIAIRPDKFANWTYRTYKHHWKLTEASIKDLKIFIRWSNAIGSIFLIKQLLIILSK